MGIRLLPLIVITSLALLGIKMFDIARNNDAFNGLFFVSETGAAAPAEENADASKNADKTDENASNEQKDEPATSDSKNSEDPEKDKSGHESSEDKASEENAPPEDVADKLPQYTPQELELLQNLSKRREELDAREHDLSIQAALLKAAAAKMDDRTEELNKLQEQASAIIKEYQQKEDEKIKSLVKIYENMKPKDAARIFDTMDMPILLEVVSNMKEAKAAPILAKMDPKNAKEITTQLADKRKLPEPDNSYKN